MVAHAKFGPFFTEQRLHSKIFSGMWRPIKKVGKSLWIIFVCWLKSLFHVFSTSINGCIPEMLCLNIALSWLMDGGDSQMCLGVFSKPYRVRLDWCVVWLPLNFWKLVRGRRQPDIDHLTEQRIMCKCETRLSSTRLVTPPSLPERSPYLTLAAVKRTDRCWSWPDRQLGTPVAFIAHVTPVNILSVSQYWLSIYSYSIFCCIIIGCIVWPALSFCHLQLLTLSVASVNKYHSSVLSLSVALRFYSRSHAVENKGIANDIQCSI